MTSAEEQSRPHRGKLRQMGATLAAFAMYSLRRFLADGCFSASGALSYTTLVSLVPLAVIAFGTLSAFPIFAQVHDELVALAFRTLVPSIGEQAAWWFRAFADSAAQWKAAPNLRDAGCLRKVFAAPLPRRWLLFRFGCAQLYDAHLAGTAGRNRLWHAVGLSDLRTGA